MADADRDAVPRWTDRTPFVVTAPMLRLPWDGHRDGRSFRCALCGHRFAAGDAARWIFTNDGTKRAPSGNPFVCGNCDGTDDEVRAKLCALVEEAKAVLPRFWWVINGGHVRGLSTMRDDR